jgi:hypothetical protein
MISIMNLVRFARAGGGGGPCRMGPAVPPTICRNARRAGQDRRPAMVADNPGAQRADFPEISEKSGVCALSIV